MSIGFPGNNWPVNSRIPALPTTNLTRPAAYQLPAASTAPVDTVEITPQIAVGIRLQGADTGQWGNNKQFASFSSDEASQLFNQLVEYANNLTPQEVYKSSVNRDEIGAVLKQLNAPNVDVDNRFFAFVSAMYDQNNYKEITTDDGTLNYFRAPEMTLDLLKRQYDDMAPADQFTVYYQPFNKVPPPPTSKYDVGNKTTDDHTLRISADKAQQYFTRLQTRSVYENNYGEVYGLPYIDDQITLQELNEEITRVSKDPSQTASSDNSDYLSFLQSLKSNFSEVAVSSPLMGTTGSGVTGGSVTGSLGVYGNLDPVNGNSGSGVISSGSGSVRPQTTGGVRPTELVITRESFMAQLDDDGNANNYTASYRVDKPIPQPQRVDMGADMVFAGGATTHKFAASEVTTALQFVTMLTGQTHFSNDMLSRLSDVFK
ncbi:MAG: hypothetical protein KC475_10540, partial [Cyanobacteria bacterium HKST-UBA03]|nr:hypothetical protein [Cyanobacteria bacterium HKST-UBA03]